MVKLAPVSSATRRMVEPLRPTPRSPSVQPPQPSWVFTTELLVPAHLIGRCVGRKGSTIRRVAEETGASLTIQCVDGRTHMPGMGDGKVVIRAEVAEVAMAAASLMRRVMTEGPPWERRRGSGGGGGAGTGPDGGGNAAPIAGGVVHLTTAVPA